MLSYSGSVARLYFPAATIRSQNQIVPKQSARSLLRIMTASPTTWNRLRALLLTKLVRWPVCPRPSRTRFCVRNDKIDQCLASEETFPEVMPLSLYDEQSYRIPGPSRLIGFEKCLRILF